MLIKYILMPIKIQSCLIMLQVFLILFYCILFYLILFLYIIPNILKIIY